MAQKYDGDKQWYVIHTYSGYEEKVAENLGQRIKGVDMADKIFKIVVPKEKTIEVKNGKRKIVEKKMFQGYVFVEMKLTEDSWYVVRNTPGVTGFVGSTTIPSPVSEMEMKKILKRMGAEDARHEIAYSLGEVVNVIDGPFKGFDGTIDEIDNEKGKIKVLISMFGRETSVQLDALQVKKIS